MYGGRRSKSYPTGENSLATVVDSIVAGCIYWLPAKNKHGVDLLQLLSLEDGEINHRIVVLSVDTDRKEALVFIVGIPTSCISKKQINKQNTYQEPTMMLIFNKSLHLLAAKPFSSILEMPLSGALIYPSILGTTQIVRFCFSFTAAWSYPYPATSRRRTHTS